MTLTKCQYLLTTQNGRTVKEPTINTSKKPYIIGVIIIIIIIIIIILYLSWSRPLIHPFWSHVSRRLFKGLPGFFLPVGE